MRAFRFSLWRRFGLFTYIWLLIVISSGYFHRFDWSCEANCSRMNISARVLLGIMRAIITFTVLTYQIEQHILLISNEEWLTYRYTYINIVYGSINMIRNMEMFECKTKRGCHIYITYLILRGYPTSYCVCQMIW